MKVKPIWNIKCLFGKHYLSKGTLTLGEWEFKFCHHCNGLFLVELE